MWGERTYTLQHLRKKFLGPLFPLFWTYAYKYLLWFLKPEWAPLFTLGRGVCVTHSLKFSSGAIPADHMAAMLISSTLVRIETMTYHAADECSAD